MALKKGTQAPDFTLQNTNGEEVGLSDFRGKSDVLLLFFSLAFSSVCTNELCSVRDNMKLYESLGVEILGISVDSFFTLREFKKSENLNFTLLSDFNKEVSQEYETLYNDYYGMKGVSKRSAYLVDTEGVIQYAEVLEDDDRIPDFEYIRKTLLRLR